MTPATNGAAGASTAHVQPGSSVLHQVAAPTALDQVMLQTEIDRRRLDINKDVAKTASKSGFYADLRSEDAALAKILAGAELGIPAMAALRVIYFFDGKITLASQAMLALARQRADGFSLEYLRSDDKSCVVRCGARGVTPTEFSFTIEEAQRAGLVRKDNWQKYPGAMCRARAVAAAIRAVCPEVILGVMATEEVDADQFEVSIGAGGQVELSKRSVAGEASPLPRTTSVSASSPSGSAIQRAEAVEAKLATMGSPTEVTLLWKTEGKAVFEDLGGKGAPRADEMTARFAERKAAVSRKPDSPPPAQESQPAQPEPASTSADQYPEPGSDG